VASAASAAEDGVLEALTAVAAAEENLDAISKNIGLQMDELKELVETQEEILKTDSERVGDGITFDFLLASLQQSQDLLTGEITATADSFNDLLEPLANELAQAAAASEAASLAQLDELVAQIVAQVTELQASSSATLDDTERQLAAGVSAVIVNLTGAANPPADRTQLARGGFQGELRNQLGSIAQRQGDIRSAANDSARFTGLRRTSLNTSEVRAAQQEQGLSRLDALSLFEGSAPAGSSVSTVFIVFPGCSDG